MLRKVGDRAKKRLVAHPRPEMVTGHLQQLIAHDPAQPEKNGDRRQAKIFSPVVGGLIFGGHRNAGGEVVDSGVSLSFDKYESNQIVSLYGVDDSKNKFAGLSVADSPSGSEVNRRIWLGRGEDGIATLALMDADGNKRLLMQVEPDGQAKFSVLDAEGNVIQNVLPSSVAE